MRVERVQDISVEDCAAEGVQIPVEQVQDPPVTALLRLTGPYPPCSYFPKGYLGQDQEERESRETIEERTQLWLRAHYASVWDALNYKRGFPWEANPYVWVIEFCVAQLSAPWEG